MQDTEIFTFGCQYLRGHSPSRDQWARDLAVLHKLHFNTIRVWLVWGVIEPAENQIDFDYLDTILNLAEQNHLRVIFLFHLHGAPEWAITKYKDCWYVDQNGRPFEPSTRANTPSGGWPGLCPDHPQVQKLEERFISAVCEHVGDRAYAYEPINEPHMWVDFVRNPNGYFCFCDETRKVFRQWLRRKYGSLDALNEAWHHCFADWDDVRPPTWHFGHADTIDWRIFTTENIAALVQRRTAVIHQHSHAPVIAHAWGGGMLTCSNLGGMAFDDWKNAQSLDKWGCSAFPSKLNQTCNVGLSMDSTRGAACGKEFWQSEIGSGDFAGGLNRCLPASPETLSIWCWEALSHGTKGLLFWQFRKEFFGNESGAYGLTDYEGNPTPRALAASRIAKVLNDNACLFNHVEMPRPQVAIVFSYRSFMFNWAEHRHNSVSCDSLGGYYRAFWEANIPVDILHEDFTTAETLGNYKLVILCCPFTLSSRFTALLPDYVSKGGTLLSDPMPAMWDEHQQLATHIPGSNLHELFGCQESSLVTNDRNVFSLSYRDGSTYELRNSFVHETWTPQDGAIAIARFTNGEPVIIAHPYGKGKAFLSGVNLGGMFSSQASISDDYHRQAVDQNNQGAGDIILDIARQCGISSAFEAPANLRIHHLVSQGHDLLIAFEFANQETSCDVSFTAMGNRPWKNLQDSSTGAFVNGKTHLAFAPHEVKVLLID